MCVTSVINRHFIFFFGSQIAYTGANQAGGAFKQEQQEQRFLRPEVRQKLIMVMSALGDSDQLGQREISLMSIAQFFLAPKRKLIFRCAGSGEESTEVDLDNVSSTACLYEKANSGSNFHKNPIRTTRLYIDQDRTEEVPFSRNPEILKSVLERVKSNTLWSVLEEDVPYFMLLQCDSFDTSKLTEKQKNDREFMLRLVETSGNALRHVSEELLEGEFGRELVLTSAKKAPHLFLLCFKSNRGVFASEALKYVKDDKEIFLTAIKASSDVSVEALLKLIPEKFREDEDILAALEEAKENQ